MMEIKNINEYQAFVEFYPRVVVHFRASWNQYDEDMHKRLSELSEIYAGSIKITSFDTSPEEHWEKCRELQISNLPSLVFYKHGRLIDKAVGLGTENKTKADLDRLLE
jgi:thioredoxin 1